MITLSPLARDASCAAVCALLNGGRLELLEGPRVLVAFPLPDPAFETLGDAGAEMAAVDPAFGTGRGTPTTARGLTAAGDLVFTGPARGITIEPSEILVGARVTVTGLTLGYS